MSVLLQAMEAKTRVLILGAGFAGLECCKSLSDQLFEVTLIDRQNHHLFQPLLYQVATASLTAPDIAKPVREILADQPNVTVLMDEVIRVDLTKQLIVSHAQSYVFDYLVIALGAKTGYFGRPEWERHAHGLKSLEDARQLRHRVLQSLERAELINDIEEKRKLLSIVIVGGGPTGVELAGAFTELIHRTLKDGFRKVAPSDLNVTLIEAAPRLLGTFDADQSEYAQRRLERLGIAVRTGTMVNEVYANRVVLESETLEAATIIWAAGTEANPVTATMPVEKDRYGRLIVGPDCALANYPNVFAIGDIANCTDKHSVKVPTLAAAAAQMGKHVGKLIRDEVRVKQSHKKSNAALLRRQFRYFDKGNMAIIGKSSAVLKANKLKMRGFFAWLAWLFVHLLLLVGFRNKLAVLLQWGFAYLRGRRSARIIVRPDQIENARLHNREH